MPLSVAARLHLLPARRAQVVAIIRRKPTRLFHVLKWNTETDEIEAGSWFRGRLDPLRSDISPDGIWLFTLATGSNGTAWNGLSRLPDLRPVWKEELRGMVYGGGFWESEEVLRTVTGAPMAGEEKVPFEIFSLDPREPFQSDVLGARLVRDGWKPISGKTGDPTRHAEGFRESTWTLPPSSGFPAILGHPRELPKHGQRFRFSLEGFPDLLDRKVDWVTRDSLGHLLVARSGAIEKYGPKDLRKGRPTFCRCLEDLRPPWECEEES